MMCTNYVTNHRAIITLQAAQTFLLLLGSTKTRVQKKMFLNFTSKADVLNLFTMRYSLLMSVKMLDLCCYDICQKSKVSA